MTSQPFTATDIDERAFSIFLMEGIQYYLEQDPEVHHGNLINYCGRLWNRWIQMSENEKLPFLDRAAEQLRYRRADIYREVIRNGVN